MNEYVLIKLIEKIGEFCSQPKILKTNELVKYLNEVSRNLEIYSN